MTQTRDGAQDHAEEDLRLAPRRVLRHPPERNAPTSISPTIVQDLEILTEKPETRVSSSVAADPNALARPKNGPLRRALETHQTRLRTHQRQLDPYFSPFPAKRIRDGGRGVRYAVAVVTGSFDRSQNGHLESPAWPANHL